METWDAIRSRRNVRSFTSDPIPDADLDQILEAGRRAPSSQNWQPWDFVVVTNRSELNGSPRSGAAPGTSPRPRRGRAGRADTARNAACSAASTTSARPQA
jgi:hypothetical protein